MSSLDEMKVGTAFQPVLVTDTQGAPLPSPSPSTSTVILCTGKVYYDLTKALADTPASQAAVIRIEELVPFPAASLRSILEQRCVCSPRALGLYRQSHGRIIGKPGMISVLTTRICTCVCPISSGSRRRPASCGCRRSH